MIGERHVIEVPNQQPAMDDMAFDEEGFGEDPMMDMDGMGGDDSMGQMDMGDENEEGMDAGTESTGNPELDSLMNLLQNAGPKQLEQIENYAKGIVDTEAPAAQQNSAPMEEMPEEGMEDMGGEDMMPQ